MSKVLVTGSGGFVASHLMELLLENELQVYTFDLKDGYDIRNYEQVRRAIDDYRPDRIFHLAALTYVPESFLHPQRAIEINTLGSLNILEAVRSLGLKTRIHLAGTSEEYGRNEWAREPVTERTALAPLSPYAIGKVAMDYFGQLYAKSYGMNVVITRAFNHAGPGRGEEFAESAFAKQIAEIELGRREVLKHGNLQSVRNYTDVRDIVRAYVQAIDLPSGVYNLCSDQNVTMQEMLDMLIDMADIPITTEVDQALYRPADFSFKRPSCKKFTDLTGWKPEIKLKTTLADILEDWRERLI